MQESNEEIGLESKTVNLHLDSKRILLMGSVFGVAAFLLNLLLIVVTYRECGHLKTLLASKYAYSVKMKEAPRRDDYYQISAGISFSLSADSQKSLNAEVIMQSSDSEYSDLVSWNVHSLKKNGIAVSRGLMRSYGLHVGDRLYSKHTVSGEMTEYMIEVILPELSSVRELGGPRLSDGVIIMGYDALYADNLTHSSVVFTNARIEDLSDDMSNMPEGIVYRSDEMRRLIKTMVPYLALFLALAVLLTCAHSVVLTKSVSHNFRRLVILGSRKGALNKAFAVMICVSAMPQVLASLVIITTLCIVYDFGSVSITVLVMITVAEVLTVLASMIVLKNRLWRV